RMPMICSSVKRVRFIPWSSQWARAYFKMDYFNGARSQGWLHRWFAAVAVLSGGVNLLALTGPMFMLQVYDRVLASRSVPNSHRPRPHRGGALPFSGRAGRDPVAADGAHGLVSGYGACGPGLRAGPALAVVAGEPGGWQPAAARSR
ncbi:hypothetical protein BTE77_35870, partial [Ensifer adhaerens]